jgi:curli biogenesis system outer membrane secretion channel CsgG
MNKLKLFLMILVVGFLTSCASRHSVLNTSYDLNRVQRIGIIKFDTHFLGMRGVENMFAKYLIQNGFKVVERAKIDDILREHKISAQGYLSPETAKLIGKILGVDALMTGSVLSYSPARKELVTVRRRIKRVEPVYGTKTHTTPSGNTKTVSEKVGERVFYDTITEPRIETIYAEVSLTAKLIDVETAEVIWVGSYSDSGVDMEDATDNIAYYLIRRLAKDWKKALEAD